MNQSQSKLRGQEMGNNVYLSVGTNIGDRENNIKQALILLEKHPNINKEKMSSIYETDPVGLTEQPKFLNGVLEISTSLSPLELLDYTQKIEKELGRKRDIKWGPRTIDLDILLYNQENIETKRLTIPHPHMYERAFVMIPLLEVNPNLKIDFDIEKCPDKSGVRIWNQYIGEEE